MIKSIILFNAIFNEKSMAISIVSDNIADSDVIGLVDCQKSTIRMMDGKTVNWLCVVFVRFLKENKKTLFKYEFEKPACGFISPYFSAR